MAIDASETRSQNSSVTTDDSARYPSFTPSPRMKRLGVGVYYLQISS